MRFKKRFITALASATTALGLVGCGPDGQGASRWPVQGEEAVPPTRPPVSGAVELANDACLMPVSDGKPIADDLGAAHRMVSRAQAFPGSDRPWIKPYNRGGQWTIDETGRYAPFPGPAVSDMFEVISVTELTTGRVIAAANGQLLSLDEATGAFSPFTHVGFDRGHADLLRVERLDLTLLIMPNQIMHVVGDTTQRWRESAELIRPRDAMVEAFDLPGMGAVLFVAEDGELRIRRDDGRWFTIGDVRRNGQVEYVEELYQSPSGRTALLRLRGAMGPASRQLAVMASEDGLAFELVDAGPVDHSHDRSGDQVFYAEATDEVLRFSQANPNEPVRWSRLTSVGYQDFEGVAPERNGDHLWLRPASIPRRDAVVMPTARGLAIYTDGRMVEVLGLQELGPIPDVIDLPSLGRTLIQSQHGLFEFTDDDQIVRLDVPFTTGGLPTALIYDDAANDQAVILAAEGQFILKRDGVFRRVPGSRAGAVKFGDERVVELPVSNDDLLLFHNALWILVSPASGRWGLCLSLS